MHKPLEAEAAIPQVEHRKVTLENGLDLILHVDRKLPVVHVNQWFHVGSKNESPGRTGFAHLFEHLMFQGSKNVAGEYFQHIERAGANLREGGVNGTTDFDRTNYFATVPSGNLEFVLWVESDRLATLMDAMTQQKLDGQREVVRNERRQSYDNQPYGRAWLVINENLHPKGHPYSWDVIGSHEDLQAATMEDVERFFRTFYTPNNLSLTIAGDFDPDQAEDLVRRYYGSIPPGPALERPRRWIPLLGGARTIEVEERAPQDRVYVCWPAPEWFGGDEAALDMASRVLSDGLSSRLTRALVYDHHVCTGVQAFNDAREISGIFGIVATLRPGSSHAGVEETIHATLQRLGSEGPTQEELDRAKTRWEFDFISGLERIGGFGGKADRLNQYNTIFGDPGMFDQDLVRYRTTSPSDVAWAVSRWLKSDQHLTVRFLRDESQKSSVTIDRSAVPELGEDAPFEPPAVHHEKLSGGMDLFVVTRRDLPKVAVSLALRGGASADPVGREGLSQLLAATIDLGTESRTALEIEEQLGNLGTEISSASFRESAGIGIEVLTRNLEPAMEIFADVARNPSFPQEELERERNRHLDNLAQQQNHAAAIAARIRPMLLFGSEHPYGRPMSGTVTAVSAVTREEIASSHERLWCAANAALIFAGDIDVETARALAETCFGDWKRGERFDASHTAEARPYDGSLFLVDKPDAPQTVIAQVLPGPERHADDLAAFRLLDAVWGGGGFGTRLNLNLREDKGYSYGIFSSYNVLNYGGAWWAGGSVQTDKTAESFTEFERELRDLAGGRPVTDEEIEAARTTRVRGYAQQFESLARLTLQISELWASDLPMEEMKKEYDDTISARAEDVREAALRWALPERAKVLLVGDLSSIEERIRELAKDELVVLDREGKVLRRG